MNAAPPKPTADCPIAVSDLLWRLPSVFGRLLFLAERFDARTGQYHDAKLAATFEDGNVHDALTALHEETFAVWAAFNQHQKLKDLGVYLRSSGTALRKATNTSINSSLQLVPPGAQDGDAFKRELAVLLLLTANRVGPSACPPIGQGVTVPFTTLPYLSTLSPRRATFPSHPEFLLISPFELFFRARATSQKGGGRMLA